MTGLFFYGRGLEWEKGSEITMRLAGFTNKASRVGVEDTWFLLNLEERHCKSSYECGILLLLQMTVGLW